ncbi:MAG TPA: GNAT family N-acetyltransferase [Luteimonas sp.]|nr:GNAT family N-acetyltransferase [Luteimonas sp.]
MAISAPSPLSDAHRLDDFRCTSPDLAKWLIERARKNHREGASRCFVVCDEQRNVIGYYALAAGAVSHELAPGSVKRNMPDPIPVAVLGRLAVHQNWVGCGIGSGLLKDAVLRTLQTSRELGIRALLCHAIDEAAKDFYLRRGFVASPMDPLTLMLSLARLGDVLRDEVAK